MNWLQQNQAHLDRCFAQIKASLDALIGAPHRYDSTLIFGVDDPEEEMDFTPAIDVLAHRFGLNRFERWLVLLAAGAELDPRIADLCAGGLATGASGFPTVGVALKALPEGHWGALTPAAPLRYWSILELDRQGPLSAGTLRIDERILHFICGIQYLDSQLWEWMSVLDEPVTLSNSQTARANEIATAWAAALAQHPGTALQLIGGRRRDRRAIASTIAAMLQVSLVETDLTRLPEGGEAAWKLARRWGREARLVNRVLLIHGAGNLSATAVTDRLAKLAEEPGLLVLTGARNTDLRGRPTLRFDVHGVHRREQREAWQASLPDADALGDALDIFVGQFDMDLDEITAVASSLQDPTIPPAQQIQQMRHRSKVLLRTELDGLARRIETKATWDALVLPAHQKALLLHLATRIHHRVQVQDEWTFGRRGGGTSVLLAGPSGTGKTLAAEVLAHELDLDLYVIDLSVVMSKYIGETEENLAKVFDAAERMGAVLLFDEADALFGKRTEVQSSHDRHANVEVSYLLHRMETFSGVAVLTTNFKDAIDRAFLRRLSAIIDFEFPNFSARRDVWQASIPAATPVGALDFDQLAALPATGGQIRAMVIHAAYVAADQRTPLDMSHLKSAAHAQFEKMGRPLAASETHAWR